MLVLIKKKIRVGMTTLTYMYVDLSLFPWI
jgi:hypothetical protein